MSHLRIGFSVFSNPAFAEEVNRYLPFGSNLEALLWATYILSIEGELKGEAESRLFPFAMRRSGVRSPSAPPSTFRTWSTLPKLPPTPWELLHKEPPPSSLRSSDRQRR